MVGRSGGWWYRAAVLLLAGPAMFVLWRIVPDLELPERAAWLPAAVILGLHAAARRYPLHLIARRRTTEFTTTTAFGVALLLMLPLPVALVGLTMTSLVPTRDPRGPRWISTVSEATRTVLIYGTAGWVIAGLDPWLIRVGGGDGSWQLLTVLVPAGLAAYVVDVVLSVVVTSIAQGASPRTVLHQDRSRFDALTFMLLVGLAPVVVVVSERAVLLAPLLLLAVVGLYRSSRLVAIQQHDAMHDSLTGLANRRHLEERLRSMVENSDMDDRFALLMMDLDRFKEVNDRLGHHVGDRLLHEVGLRLGRIEGVDIAARIGGDEFAFLIRRVADHAELLRMGERLVSEVSQPYVVADVRLTVGASVGIALFPDHGLDAPSLLRRADSAMYAAKRSSTPVGFAAVQDEGTGPGRVSLLAELEEGIRRDELKLDYQPKVSLRTGEVVGVESLLRWHHPEHGLVPPSLFVSTVEHTDLISVLTRHVLDTALADAARWRIAGVVIPVAVNISTRDLLNLRLARDLADLLEAHDFAADSLTLEITESALQVDPQRSSQVLEELEELGVQLSIDDFGTGYSSLAALRHLPVAELKIDRSFVLGMDEPAGVAIVHAMVELAHALDLSVVAEGVEDDTVMEQLRAQGCDVAQGYLVGRPLPAHLVAPWIRARREELASDRGRFAPPSEAQAPRRDIRAV